MRRRWMTVAVACLAPPGAAQPDRAAWIIELSSPTVSPAHPSVSVRLLAAFPREDYAWSQAIWDVSAEDGEWSGLARLLAQAMLPGERLGTARGSDVQDIRIGQLNFYNGGPWADPANPLPVWEGTWTATDFTPRLVEVNTRTFLFDVYPHRLGSWFESRLSVLDEGTARIRVVPCPTPAVLLLSFLAGLRRRRSRL